MKGKSVLITKEDLRQENRSDVLAALLAFFGGSLGLHRLYLGHYVTAGLIILIQLLTKFKFIAVFVIIGIVDGAIILLLSKEIREEKAKKREERRDRARRNLPGKNQALDMEKTDVREVRPEELKTTSPDQPENEEQIDLEEKPVEKFSYDQYDPILALMDVDNKFLNISYIKESLVDLFNSNLLILREDLVLDKGDEATRKSLEDYFSTGKLDDRALGVLEKLWNLSDNSLRKDLGHMPLLRVEDDWKQLGESLADFSLDRLAINMEEFNFDKVKLKDLYEILDIWPGIWETIAERMVEMNYKQTIDHLEEVKENKEYVNIVRKVYNTSQSDELKSYCYQELKRLNVSLTPTEKRIYEAIK